MNFEDLPRFTPCSSTIAVLHRVTQKGIQVGLAHCRIEIYLLHQKVHMYIPTQNPRQLPVYHTGGYVRCEVLGMISTALGLRDQALCVLSWQLLERAQCGPRLCLNGIMHERGVLPFPGSRQYKNTKSHKLQDDAINPKVRCLR